MSAQLKVFCKNISRYIDFKGGETLTDILHRIAGEIPFTPICARVNNKTEDLQYAVFAPKQVEYLPVTSNSGMRVYIRSLCMMLYRAVAECYPGTRLNICHSISKGYYCRLDNVEVTAAVVENLRSAMLRLVERDVPFERKERLTVDVKEMFRAEGLDDKVALLDTIHEPLHGLLPSRRRDRHILRKSRSIHRHAGMLRPASLRERIPAPRMRPHAARRAGTTHHTGENVSRIHRVCGIQQHNRHTQRR